MNNADMPAMPVGDGQVGMGDVNSSACGLTKREELAARFAAALAPRYETRMAHDREQVAAEACQLADALLAELERTGGQS